MSNIAATPSTSVTDDVPVSTTVVQSTTSSSSMVTTSTTLQTMSAQLMVTSFLLVTTRQENMAILSSTTAPIYVSAAALVHAPPLTMSTSFMSTLPVPVPVLFNPYMTMVTAPLAPPGYRPLP